MLNVSDTAYTMLSSLLSESNAPEGVAARITNTEQGLTLTIDEVQNSDETFNHDGKTVLAVDESVTDHVNDKSLEVVTTPQGPQLTLAPVGGAT